MLPLLSPGPLFDTAGKMHAPGYHTRPVVTMESPGRSPALSRLMGWNGCYVGSDAFGLMITVAEDTFTQCDSVTLLDWEAPRQGMTERRALRRPGRRRLSPELEQAKITAAGRGYEIHLDTAPGRQSLYGYVEAFQAGLPLHFDLEFTAPPRDSLVLLQHFAGHAHAFWYSRFMPCMRAEGQVLLGEKVFPFAPAVSFATLGRGRGILPRGRGPCLASACGVCEGHPFGFILPYCTGASAAPENGMLFWDGVGSAVEGGRLSLPGSSATEGASWQLCSADGRVNLAFTPLFPGSGEGTPGLQGDGFSGVFGFFTGTAVLGSGKRVTIKRLPGFAGKACR